MPALTRTSAGRESRVVAEITVRFSYLFASSVVAFELMTVITRRASARGSMLLTNILLALITDTVTITDLALVSWRAHGRSVVLAPMGSFRTASRLAKRRRATLGGATATSIPTFVISGAILFIVTTGTIVSVFPTALTQIAFTYVTLVGISIAVLGRVHAFIADTLVHSAAV